MRMRIRELCDIHAARHARCELARPPDQQHLRRSGEPESRLCLVSELQHHHEQYGRRWSTLETPLVTSSR